MSNASIKRIEAWRAMPVQAFKHPAHAKSYKNELDAFLTELELEIERLMLANESLEKRHLQHIADIKKLTRPYKPMTPDDMVKILNARRTGLAWEHPHQKLAEAVEAASVGRLNKQRGVT